MDDITSRDEEKAREQATEKARKEEQDRQKEREQVAEKARKEEQARQKEREQATEKGRKQGQEQERAQQKAKRGPGMGIIIALVILIIALAAIVWFSVSVTDTDVTPGTALPFTTNYAVSFPEGQTVTFGNSHINVLSVQNEVITDIDGNRQKLVVGEQRVIPERRGKITIFGITPMDVNYKITLTYKGERDNRAYFDMAVLTSKQVPDLLLKRLLPSEIDARLT
jgi:flagellar biosynthesis GTPase FlhF